jgi:alpha-galactosidase
VWSRVADDGSRKKNYFSFEQDGQTFRGTMEYPWGGKVGLRDGRINGSQVRFVRDEDPPAGSYSGMVENGRMHLALKEKSGTTLIELQRLPPGTPLFENPAPLPQIQTLPANGVARLPPMGWNAWNHFHDDIDDKTVREVADAIVATGMRDAGYTYINIDDEWAGERDPQGFIHPNRNFPDMPALAVFLHANKLKLGLYSSPGPETCEGHHGSMGHEAQDAQTYAFWGADYLKYDWCSASFLYPDEDMQAAYQKMGKALQQTGRPIVYSLCQYGKQRVPEWGAKTGGNLWRTTPDISDSWKSMIYIWTQQHAIARWNRPGGWNDPDMLEVGNGGMTEEEYRTHFSLWALLSAPLLAGNDPRNMSAATLATLTNKDIIAIDQDPLASPPAKIDIPGPIEIWQKPLSNGDVAILLLNTTATSAHLDTSWKLLGLPSHYLIRDLWTHKNIGTTDGVHAEIPSHGVKVFRLMR